MIDHSTIQRILDVADIVDVVKEFVTLRKSGTNYKGLCPFHDEKTPSFTVSPSKQLCKCFSCGKGGNVVHFVMEHEQMTYPEAIRWLGKKYGIEVQEKEMSAEERTHATLRESMFVLNEWARDYFSDILRHHVDGVAFGMSYFRQRGFRDDIIKKFQLGFCLSSRDSFVKTALAKGFQAEFLEKTGLCYRTDDGRLLDRYWGRVIFPVHTVSGKVVAFGGRILNNDKKLAKYVNSPESEIYSKSKELYGLFLAKHAIVKQNCCYLVEGYTDVISMHQCGIENVVASSGTSLTEGQIRLIHRFTNNITVLYDGDAAGIKASLRGIDMLLAEGLNVKVLLLPDGEDPDSFSRSHSAHAFQQYIDEKQVDFIKFKIELLKDDCGNDPIKKAGLIQNIVHSLSMIPDRIVRDMYIKESSSLLDVKEELLVTEILRNRKEGKEENKKTNPSDSDEHLPLTQGEPIAEHKKILISSEEENLLKVIIKYGDKYLFTYEEEGQSIQCSVAQFILGDLSADGLHFSAPLYMKMLEEAAHLDCKETDHISLSYFLSHTNSEMSQLAAEMAEDKYVLSTEQSKGFVSDEKRLDELVPRLMHDFKGAIVRKEIGELLYQLKQPNVVSDSEKCMEIMQKYKELTIVEQQLSRMCGDRVIHRLS